MYLSVGCLVVNSSQPNIPQTSPSGTHTHRQHTATYQINEEEILLLTKELETLFVPFVLKCASFEHMKPSGLVQELLYLLNYECQNAFLRCVSEG